MARYDVYPMPRGGPGVLLDVQANLLDQLRTRTMVPLVPRDGAPPAIRGLNPVFSIGGVAYVMLTQAIATVPVKELGPPIASLQGEADVVMRALDVLFSGV